MLVIRISVFSKMHGTTIKKTNYIRNGINWVLVVTVASFTFSFDLVRYVVKLSA
jgi:hypothetical protein